VLVEVEHDSYIFTDDTSEHRLHAGDDRVQVEPRRLDDLLAAERRQLVRQRRGAHAGPVNFGDV
jgi:hypothetical protein